MDRRAFITVLSGCIAVAPLGAEAQLAAKIARGRLLDMFASERKRLADLGDKEPPAAVFSFRGYSESLLWVTGYAAEYHFTLEKE